MTDGDETLISFRQLQDRFGGVSRGTIYNLIVRYPDFPKPVALLRHKLWREKEVTAFIASLPHEGDDDAA